LINQCIVLTGGEGTRLNDKVRFAPAVETPKPLMEVSGKPFVTFAINMMKGVGVVDIPLMVLYRRECYEFLQDKAVRLVQSEPDVNEAVLAVPGLQDLFLVLNGDCYPIMDKTDWYHLLNCTEPCIPVKIINRDAGIAVVSKEAVTKGWINCSRLGDMRGKYREYTILGGLHIGTPLGLQNARNYFMSCCWGE
jgi:NDP-sugar pyrophosphorylase family protein